MGVRLRLVGSAVHRVSRDPRKIRLVAQGTTGKIRHLMRPPKYGELEEDAEGWKKRTYGEYGEYVRHQASKLETMKLRGYDKEYRDQLFSRLTDQDGGWEGMSVLCLGARLGTEVKAFLDAGALAIGIDLNPGPSNKYVVVGDFHDIQYPRSSVDVVFTNSLDHCGDIGVVLREVARVLKRGGIFVLEAIGEGERLDEWASLSWPSTGALIARIEEEGFVLVSRAAIDKPWEGHHLRFRLV